MHLEEKEKGFLSKCSDAFLFIITLPFRIIGIIIEALFSGH